MTVAAAWPGPANTSSRRMQWFSKRARPSEVHFQIGIRPTDGSWVSNASSSWEEQVLKQLVEINCLDQGWDGGDALSVSSTAIETAITVLAATMAADSAPPAVVPTAAGGLQLEWHRGGIDLEVYIDSGGKISAWCQEGAREWEEDYFPRSRLSKELARLATTSGE